VKAWATAGDDDGRLVVAYRGADGVEVAVVRDAPGWRENQFDGETELRVLASNSRLGVHGPLDDVRVGSTASVEVVAGPVGQAQDGAVQAWWRSADDDHENGPTAWTRMPCDPRHPLLKVFDVADSLEPGVLALDARGPVLLDGGTTIVLDLEPTAVCFIAHALNGVHVYAAQQSTGPVFALADPLGEDPRGPVDRTVPIPPGILRAATCGFDREGALIGYALVDDQLHAVPLGLDNTGNPT
jgi:hypothetical protein